MPDVCVVFGCNNTPNQKGGAEDPLKRKRRKKWVDFVQLKQAHWNPSKYSAVCSKHFRDNNFTVKFLDLTRDNRQLRLLKDEVGVCVLPTVHTLAVQSVGESVKHAESERSKRKVRKLLL